MRIGIIGAGTMARVHAQALGQIEQVQVVALATAQQTASAAAFATELGVELLTVTALLARADVDAVVVAIPTDHHAAVVTASAQAGKHIFCEKPLARTLAEGEAMLEAVTTTGVKLAIGHVVRYFPAYVAVHDRILRGDIGTPGVARTTRGAGFPQVPGNWYADTTRSGGVVLDMMIHDLDWLRWTLGPVVRIHAQGLAFRGIAGKDAAMAILRFQNDALAYVEGSWSYVNGFRTTLEVSGSGGLLRTGSTTTEPLTFELAPTTGAAGVAVPTGNLNEDPYLLQLRAVIGWFEGGPLPRFSSEDALAALHLSLATLESIRSGQPINFAQPV